MEPFLAIAELLKHRGEDVCCLFPEQFRHLAEESGFDFETLDSKFMDLLNTKEGKAAMGGSSNFFVKALAMIKLAIKFKGVNKELVRRQQAVIDQVQPDRIVYHSKAVYPVIWSKSNPGKAIMVSPVPYLHYVPGHSHLGFKAVNMGTFLNRLSYKLADFGLIKTIQSSAKNTGNQLSGSEIKQIMSENTTLYSISPSLFAPSDSWNGNPKVVGFHERDKTVNWQPTPELEGFLSSHEKVLFISFGSMINPQPERKTQILLDVLNRHQIPAVINTSSGGLVEPETYDSNRLHFVNQIPYDWIFKKVHAVIHHGGSGTTHMGLKHGLPTMIIPHIIDQFVWNRLVEEIGAGPLGSDISYLGPKIETQILDLISNSKYQENAKRIGSQMQAENFQNVLYEEIVK